MTTTQPLSIESLGDVQGVRVPVEQRCPVCDIRMEQDSWAVQALSGQLVDSVDCYNKVSDIVIVDDDDDDDETIKDDEERIDELEPEVVILKRQIGDVYRARSKAEHQVKELMAEQARLVDLLKRASELMQPIEKCAQDNQQWIHNCISGLRTWENLSKEIREALERLQMPTEVTHEKPTGAMPA